VCGDVKGSSDMHQMETLDPGVIPPYKPSELASSGLHEQQGGSRRGVGGTPAYMAPEQFTATMSEDISLVTPKADIYALGSTLYHILTGKAPHLPKEGVKESPDAFYFRITTGMIPPPREKDTSIPKLLEQIVLKAMQVEPSDRYASARELAEDIKRYVSDEPVHAYQESGLEKSRRWIRKNRALVGATMVMLLLVAVVSIGFGFVKLEHSQELAKRNQELEVSKKEVEGERDRANQQTKFAESEKKKAEVNEKIAKEQKEKVNQQLYINKIQRSNTEWLHGDPLITHEQLVSIPFQQRRWEHDFLSTLYNSGQVTLEGHTEAVTSVSFSPDGKKIVSGSWDNTLKIWNANTGQEIITLKGHKSPVNCVSFSPDGKKIVSGSGSRSYFNGTEDHPVKIWDATTGQEIRTFEVGVFGVTSVSFSPDGKKIASGSKDGVKIWDTETGKALQTGAWGTTSVSFSPDGKKIVSGSKDKTLKIWDANTGQEIITLKGHTDRVTSVSFSPDGKRIVSGSEDGVKIWDANTGQEILTLKGHKSSVNCVSFSPDGKKIVSGSGNVYYRTKNTIKIWNANTGQEILTLKGHTDGVNSVSFSPDGKRIVSGSKDGVKIWDANTGQEILTLKGHTDGVTSISFSPDGKKIASGSDDYSIKIWEAETGKELQTLTGHTEVINSVSFSPDGKKLLSSSGDFGGGDKNKEANHLKIWDLTTGKNLAILNKQKGSVYAATFSPDGKKIASGSWDNIKIWDAENGKELQTLTGATSWVTSVSFSPDGGKIVSGSKYDVKIWDTETGKALQTGAWGTTSVSFSPDGKRIVSGSWDKTLKIWDAKSGQEIITLKGHTDGVNSVSFSPDGKRIVSGSEDGVKIWDANTGQEIITLKGHTDGVNSVSFSPDGKRIVSAGADGDIKIWTAAEKMDKALLQGEMSDIVGMDIENNKIIAWNSKGLLKYWDFKTGAAINENNLECKIEGGCLLDDGKNLFVWDDLFSIWLIDIANEKTKIKVEGNEHPIIIFFANKKNATTIDKKGVLKTFDLETGTEIKSTLLGTWNGSNATFSSDGKKIARSCENYDKHANSIIIWEAETGKELKTFTGHNSSVTSISFSPDGKKIASGSYDYSIKIWDAETGKELQTLTGHTDTITSLSFSPDGKKLLSASGELDYENEGKDKNKDVNHLKMWDLSTGKEQTILSKQKGSVYATTFSQDGKKIASGSDVIQSRSGKQKLAKNYRLSPGILKIFIA